MTNLEVIQHLIGDSAEVAESRLNIACQLLGLDPTGTYDGNNQPLKCLVYKVAIAEITRSVEKIKRETEGGYTKEYIDSTAENLQQLANDSGCQELIDSLDTTPKVRNASKFW